MSTTWKNRVIPVTTIGAFGSNQDTQDLEDLIEKAVNGEEYDEKRLLDIQEVQCKNRDLWASSDKFKNIQASEIRKAIKVLSQGKEYDYEVRAKTKRGMLSGRFDDRDSSVSELINQLQRKEYQHNKETHAGSEKNTAWWLIPNPLNPDLSKISYNTLDKALSGNSTSDTDITERRWLLIDFDPNRAAADSSSSLKEKMKARNVTLKCIEYLEMAGFPEPVIADSGNGYHLLFAVDQSNDDASRDKHKKILAILGKIFSNGQVTVDPTTYNAARLFKLYGTFARKGGWEIARRDPMDTRPWRYSSIISAPDALEHLSDEKMDEFIAKCEEVRSEEHTEKKEVPYDLSRKNDTKSKSSVNPEDFFSTALANVGYDFSTMRSVAVTHAEKGWRGECPFCNGASQPFYLYVMSDGAMGASCHEATCQLHKSKDHKQRWDTFRSLCGVEKKTFNFKEDNNDSKNNKTVRLGNTPQKWTGQPTDIDIEHRFIYEMKQVSEGQSPIYAEGAFWIFSPATGCWEKKSEGFIHRYIRTWDKEKILDKDGKIVDVVNLRNNLINSCVTAMTKTLLKETFFAQRPYGILVNGRNFIEVDVENKTLKKVRAMPDHKARILIKANYNTNPSFPEDSLLYKYMEGVTQGETDVDEKAKRWKQIAEILFAAATGIGPHLKKAIFVTGEKGSGKSQLLTLISNMFGADAESQMEYVASLEPQKMSERFATGTLIGKSVNIVHEVPDWSFQDDSNFKALVTGDALFAEIKNGPSFTFTPRILNVFAANALPKYSKNCDAFWSRVQVVPFPKVVWRDSNDEIKNIAAKIIENEMDQLLSFILILGIGVLENDAYTEPKIAREAKDRWISDSDQIRGWLSSSTVGVKDGLAVYKWPTLSSIYKKYAEDTKDQGEKPSSLRTFKKRLEDMGIMIQVAHKQDRVALTINDFNVTDEDRNKMLEDLAKRPFEDLV